MTTTSQRLGRGWPFPIHPADDGSIVYLDGPDKVVESITLILETEPGERAMRPTFGCGLRRYLMKPNTPATRALIQRDVERALAAWEPRIDVQLVDVSPHPDEPSRVDIAITYIHTRDKRPGNLVYPFYLE